MPTSRGWGLLVAGVGLAVLTWWTRATELAVLAVPAVVLPLLAWLWVLVPFRVQVRRWIEPPTVQRGDPCIGVLAVTNARSRRSPALEVLDRRAGREIAVAIPRLAAQATHPTTYPLPTARRGVFPLGPLTARRSDPLRLAEATAELGGRTTFTVHPLSHHLDALPGGMRASLDGSAQQIPFGSSVFHGLREYVIGDDHRKIHWLSTARVGQLQVRVYRDSSVPTLTVLLDDRASRYGEDRFEDAVEVAASVLDLAERHDLGLVIVTLDGGRAGTPGDRLDRNDALDFLSRVQVSRQPRLRLYDPGLPTRGATVLLVTGALDDADGADLLHLRAATARLSVCALVARPGDATAVPEGIATLTVSRADQLPDRWEAAVG
jgi:uncharacterized protein (DUF58 family)